MPRSCAAWRARVEELLARVRPAFDAAGAPIPERVSVAAGGRRLVAMQDDGVLRLGFPADETRMQSARAAWGKLLGIADPLRLERLLDLLVVRLALCELARDVRVRRGLASGDEWVEARVGAEVAWAITARLFESQRDFLEEALPAARESLARFAEVEGPTAELVDDLAEQIRFLLRDLDRTDIPAPNTTLAVLASDGDVEERHKAENDLVLMRALEEGSPALRKAAAELYAEEADAPAIAALLADMPRLPPEVRLTLAARLRQRGGQAEAADHLRRLVAAEGTPLPVVAAAALLLDDAAAAGLDTPRLLAALDEEDLVEALRLVPAPPAQQAVRILRVLLRHGAAAVRREAWRLAGSSAGEADAWAAVHDEDSAVRAAAVAALPTHPALARALMPLLLDPVPQVRDAALVRAMADGPVSARLRDLLAEDGSDQARRALAMLVAPGSPQQAQDLLGRLLRRAMRPFVSACSAARALPADEPDAPLVQKLAEHSLAQARREQLAFSAQALGRYEWIDLHERLEAFSGPARAEATQALAQALPEGWYETAFVPPPEKHPVAALRTLAETHPDSFVRAAILLWLVRSAREDAGTAARLAEQDPAAAVSELAALLRQPSEDPMALTAVEKALFLRTVNLFRSVPTPSLLAVAGAMRVMEHAPGEPIVQEGERGDRLHILYDGAARVEKRKPDGSPLVLATMPPGTVFGEMSLFDSEPRSASVTAVVPSRTLALDAPAFQRLGMQYPEILWEVCRVLSQRLRAGPSAPAPASQQAAAAQPPVSTRQAPAAAPAGATRHTPARAAPSAVARPAGSRR